MKRVIREQARQLRQEGISVIEIAKQLGVSKGSVSIWVRDIELTPEQIERLNLNRRRYAAQNKGARKNREKAQVSRRAYQEQGRLRAREGRSLHLAGCMLYWAEGAKDQNTFYFVNSDPHMLTLCIRFLREEMAVEEERITIRIHCHSNDPDEMCRVETYWLALLHLQPSALRKTLFKQGSEKSKHVLPNGVCAIRVHKSTALIHHIYGAIQEYAGFDNPDWLF